MALQVNQESLDLVGRDNQRHGAAGRQHRALVARVEGQDLVHRGFRQTRRGGQVEGNPALDGDEVGPVGNAGQAEPEEFGLRNDVLEGLQLGHVVTRLARHVEVLVLGGQARRAVLGHRPAHRAFAPVVGSQGQVPVAVHLVDGLQVVEGRVGGGDHVAPLIDPPVLLELVVLAGGRNELPQAGGLGRRQGHRIEGALHHRQQRELGGHAAPLEFLDDVVEVTLAAGEDLAQGAGAVDVVDLPDLNTDLVTDRQIYYINRPGALRQIFTRGQRYLYHIVDELERRGMPTELALLPMVESAFNPMALSSAQASGLWQFIPSTGKSYKLEQNWWVDERRDVIASTNAALDYLQTIYEMHGDWQLALASYNWGEGAVGRAVAKNRAAGLPTEYQHLNMPGETRYY
ncbi:MAG: hypothetical protein E6R15_13185, partial [Zoogloea sp.]